MLGIHEFKINRSNYIMAKKRAVAKKKVGRKKRAPKKTTPAAKITYEQLRMAKQ